MTRHLERVQLVEELGFSAIWLRDVPFNVPSFGDAGQMYDPFVYLGLLAARLIDCTGCRQYRFAVTPSGACRQGGSHVDVLSGGRLILHRVIDWRSILHSTSRSMIEAIVSATALTIFSACGRTPQCSRTVTATPVVVWICCPSPSREAAADHWGWSSDPEWIARNGDGWLMYPRAIETQAQIIKGWRARVEAAGCPAKPAVQSLYVDLTEVADASPQPIHLGFRLAWTIYGPI